MPTVPTMNPDLDTFLWLFSDNPDIWFHYGPGETQNYFEALLERFLEILDVTLARGEQLGYQDGYFEKIKCTLTGTSPTTKGEDNVEE